MRCSSRRSEARQSGAKIASQSSDGRNLTELNSGAKWLSGSAVLTPAVGIIKKWGELKEATVSHARLILRQCWKWPEVWAAVVIFSLLMRIIFNASFQEKMTEQTKATIEQIKEQNAQSISDRIYLREELSNTKSALKRLERTVKTGEYP